LEYFLFRFLFIAHLVEENNSNDIDKKLEKIIELLEQNKKE